LPIEPCTLFEPSYAAQIAIRIASNDLTAVIKTAPNDRSNRLYAIKRVQEATQAHNSNEQDGSRFGPLGEHDK
jgi:hypothetical protein